MMAQRVMKQGNIELSSIGSGNEGEARLGDSAHLVQSSVLHGILRSHDIIAEITA